MTHHHQMITFALLAGALSAQSSDTDVGPLAGTHAALTRALLGAPPETLDEVLIKAPGFFTSAPLPMTVPIDTHHAALFGPRGTSCPAALPQLEVDAISIGFDFIECDPTGVVNAAFLGDYYALLFSVTRASPGAAGGTIATEAAATDGALGDLFSYLFTGSRIGPTDLTQRAVDSTEIRLAGVEVDGLDWYLPFYQLVSVLADLLPDPTLYFSVSAATVPAVPVAWYGGVPTSASGATIFRTTWSRATRTWSCPQVFLTPANLGLTPADDVDALAVDTILHAETYVVFSTTTPGSHGSPLLFMSTGALGTRRVFRLGNGTPVADRLGLGSAGDVDAISAIDPGLPWRRGVGIPGPGIGLPAGTNVNNSWRAPCGGGDCLLTFGLNRNLNPLLFLIEVPAGSFSFLSPVVASRNISFNGFPGVLSIPIPAGLPPATIGCHWVEIDLATFTVLGAPPSFFRL